MSYESLHTILLFVRSISYPMIGTALVYIGLTLRPMMKSFGSKGIRIHFGAAIVFYTLGVGAVMSLIGLGPHFLIAQQVFFDWILTPILFLFNISVWVTLLQLNRFEVSYFKNMAYRHSINR